MSLKTQSCPQRVLKGTLGLSGGSAKYLSPWASKQCQASSEGDVFSAFPRQRGVDAHCSTYWLLPSQPQPLPVESERVEGLPPGLAQVEGGGIFGLVDQLPARMGQVKKQHSISLMPRQLIEHHLDSLNRGRDGCLNPIKQVHELLARAAAIGCRHHFTAGWLQRTQDIALALGSSVIHLLVRSRSRACFRSAGWLPTLVQNGSVLRAVPFRRYRRLPCWLERKWRGFHGPLCSAKSGSIRSPNQPS